MRRGRLRVEPLPLLVFLGGTAALLLAPLLWGSTWTLGHGRLVVALYALAVFGWWELRQPRGTYVHAPPRRPDAPPYRGRHRP